MALEATGDEPIERGMSAGFSLRMRDGDRNVLVVVSHEALKAFDPGSGPARDTLLARRSRIEDVARGKYERGEIARNGHVSITGRDLAD